VLERFIENRDQYRQMRTDAAPPAGLTMGVAHPAQPAAPTGQRSVTTCPECGSSVEHVSGCVVCYNCGWSKC
jgi:hypothetical protein